MERRGPPACSYRGDEWNRDVTVDDLLEVVGTRKTNPEHVEEWYKKADWWKKAVADFDRREAKTHAERVGETMRSREGKAEAARAPPGSRRSRSNRTVGVGPGVQVGREEAITSIRACSRKIYVDTSECHSAL